MWVLLSIWDFFCLGRCKKCSEIREFMLIVVYYWVMCFFFVVYNMVRDVSEKNIIC